MEIPSHVKIGAINYRVDVVDVWPGSGYDDGETSWKKGRGNVIFINDDLTDEAKGVVFVHESFHAMNSTMNHEFLDSFAQQTYAWLTDNKLCFCDAHKPKRR